MDAADRLALLLKSLVGRQLEEGCIHPLPFVYHVLELVEQEQTLLLVSNVLIVDLIKPERPIRRCEQELRVCLVYRDLLC